MGAYFGWDSALVLCQKSLGDLDNTCLSPGRTTLILSSGISPTGQHNRSNLVVATISAAMTPIPTVASRYVGVGLGNPEEVVRGMSLNLAPESLKKRVVY